jgi:hypothetical protein
MKTSRFLLGVMVLFIAAMGAVTYAMQLDQGLVVRIPNEITINEKELPAGEYEIRKTSNVNPVFQFFNKDELKYEANALAIPAENNAVVEDSKVVMQKIGNDFYLTKIWLSGTKIGYELPLPERAKSLQRELEQSIPSERPGTPISSNTRSTPAADAPEPQALAENTPPASTTTPRPEPTSPQVAQNTPQQTPVEPRQQQAPAEAGQQPVSPDQQPSRAAQPAQTPANAQDDSEPRSLPATASQWPLYILAGLSLLILSQAVRRG